MVESRKKDIEDRAKWLYLFNAGSSVEEMKVYLKQAIKEFHFEEALRLMYAMYDITYDDYVNQVANRLFCEL